LGAPRVDLIKVLQIRGELVTKEMMSELQQMDKKMKKSAAKRKQN